MLELRHLQKLLHGEYYVSKLDDGCNECWGCSMGTQCDKYFLYQLTKYAPTELGLLDVHLYIKIIDDHYKIYPIKVYLDDILIVTIYTPILDKLSLQTLKSAIVN